MLKVIIILLFFSFYLPANSSPKDKIISQMKLTNNLSFNFKQTINDKSEDGKCIIEYPKKIFCVYNNANKKILVSNGSSLVIETNNKGSYYRYPLNKTPLEFLLDKEYLISKIEELEPRDIDNKYLNFKIFENNNEINIFFDKKDLNLTGWQTEDIYQNLSITFISSIKKNQEIDGKIFKLPENN
ncbi:outer-membrane lipoprotein carrier protein LolA [Candidatus Pelagibacter ubique]|jgi:outer membrane lipoprotein-sorting protein|nr:outer-membrane lipoprotein carrier protein LolA [Candidatus Pelagibacter ubique]